MVCANKLSWSFPFVDGMCSISGDPHHITFDGVRIDFQGNCKYRLAAYTGSEGFDTFEVSAISYKDL